MNNAGQTPSGRYVLWRHSIQTKMAGVIALMMTLILAVNLFLNSRISSMVERIDSVFASNVSITEYTETLNELEGYVYEYLNTKSSTALENYYRYAQKCNDMAENLNDRNVDNPVLMLEKNIRSMSMDYLDKAEKTVQAKRGRNVERYKLFYEEGAQLCSYINAYVYELNTLLFTQNSENYQLLLNALRFMEIFSVAVIAGIVVFSMIALIMMIRAMIAPLMTLSEAAHQVAGGDLDIEVPVVDARDEMGIVTQTFNQMLGSIRDYITRVRENMQDQARMKERELSMEANLKEAQLKFLQAQINPHFLFNSLNAGAQLAMMEDAEATGVFLERMADFFRYNVKKTNGDSTLGEEMELVDNYIYILNVRFAGDISFSKEVEPGLEQVRVPGMILQPLVENAVTHGIRDMMDRGKISMSICREEEGIRVTVTDNGAGMTKEQIQDILEGTLVRPEGAVSTGIGLGNVKNRLRLFYDQDGLLCIYSQGKGMGTEVTVLLPALPDADGITEEDRQQTERERLEDVSDIDRG